MNHEYDVDGICAHCGHDGADAQHQRAVLKAEIGVDEYVARSMAGEFATDFNCPKRADPRIKQHD